MFRINNNDFKILDRYKTFLVNLDNLLENVPRKDMYFKDRIRNCSLDILELIIKLNTDNDVNVEFIIKSKISMMDFLLERLYVKKYISEKALVMIGNQLVEINRMVGGLINSIKNGSKI